MEPVNFGYSDKNIPIAKPREYLKCLIEKTESFLRRGRWKAYHFLNPPDKPTSDIFGFPNNCHRQTKSLTNLKIICLHSCKISNLITKVVTSRNEDTTQIRADTKLLVPADKTTNFCRLDSHSYNQLMHTAIAKSYKKASSNTANKIISEEKKIAENLNLSNRIDALAAKNDFVTLKDRKPNFQNHPTCRLINPTKSEISVINKKILQRINSNIVTATQLNQWKNTSSIIEWFKKIPNKPQYSFVTFDRHCRFLPLHIRRSPYMPKPLNSAHIMII